MRYAVASLWTIPSLFLLCFAAVFGAFDGHGRAVIWLFVLDVVVMIALSALGLIDASDHEPGRERRRLIALSLPTLVFGIGAALMLYAVTHTRFDL